MRPSFPLCSEQATCGTRRWRCACSEQVPTAPIGGTTGRGAVPDPRPTGAWSFRPGDKCGRIADLEVRSCDGPTQKHVKTPSARPQFRCQSATAKGPLLILKETSNHGKRPVPDFE